MYKDYVSTTGVAYFDTGVKPTVNTKIIAVMSFSEYTGNVSFGTSNGNDSNDYRFFNYSGGFIFDIGNQRLGKSTVCKLTLNKLYIIEIGNCYVTVKNDDGSNFGSFTGTKLSSLSISNTIKIGGEDSSYNACNIYRFTIYERNEIIKEYAPIYEYPTYKLKEIISGNVLNPIYKSSGSSTKGSTSKNDWSVRSDQIAIISKANDIGGHCSTTTRVKAITKSELSTYNCKLGSNADSYTSSNLCVKYFDLVQDKMLNWILCNGENESVSCSGSSVYTGGGNIYPYSGLHGNVTISVHKSNTVTYPIVGNSYDEEFYILIHIPEYQAVTWIKDPTITLQPSSNSGNNPLSAPRIEKISTSVPLRIGFKVTIPYKINSYSGKFIYSGEAEAKLKLNTSDDYFQSNLCEITLKLHFEHNTSTYTS